MFFTYKFVENFIFNHQIDFEMTFEISEKLLRKLSQEDLEEEFCCMMIRWNYYFEQMMSLASKILTEDIVFSSSSFSSFYWKFNV